MNGSVGKGIKVTYTIFNKEHAGGTSVNMSEVMSQSKNIDGSYRADRRTDKPKSIKRLFNVHWKVLKSEKISIFMYNTSHEFYKKM